MSYFQGYQPRPEDHNGMSGVVEHGAQATGDKPLKIKLKLTPDLARRAVPPASPGITGPGAMDIDNNRANTRSTRNQYSRPGSMSVDNEVEMSDATGANMQGGYGQVQGGYGPQTPIQPNACQSASSKKNTGRQASKDIRSSGGPAMGQAPSTPVSARNNRTGMMGATTPGRGMNTPGSSSGVPYGAPVTPGVPVPSTPLQHQKNIRMETSAPGTPGGFLEDSLPGGEGDNNSAFGSDDEEGGANKSKSKNKRGKPKAKAGASGRNSKIKDDDESIYGDEDAHSAGYNAASAIWKTVEAYFADFTDEDIRFCMPDTKDDSFKIPNLGRKNPNLGLASSTADLMDIAPAAPGTSGFGSNGPSLIARLMSTLVEETTLNSIPGFLNSRTPLVDMAISPHEMDPLFGVVSQQEADFIEQKLKRELTALGLFGDMEPTTPAPQTPTQGGGKDGKGEATEVVENDEVVSELKRLQSKLRAQLDVNNHTKATIRQQIEATNGVRKRAKQEREELNKKEAHYVTLHKAILKKKKKPAGKTIVKSED